MLSTLCWLFLRLIIKSNASSLHDKSHVFSANFRSLFCDSCVYCLNGSIQEFALVFPFLEVNRKADDNKGRYHNSYHEQCLKRKRLRRRRKCRRRDSRWFQGVDSTVSFKIYAFFGHIGGSDVNCSVGDRQSACVAIFLCPMNARAKATAERRTIGNSIFRPITNTPVHG